jgi:hypothetical protein
MSDILLYFFSHFQFSENNVFRIAEVSTGVVTLGLPLDYEAMRAASPSTSTIYKMNLTATVSGKGLLSQNSRVNKISQTKVAVCFVLLQGEVLCEYRICKE